tara:strand:+ start:297 stop:665 length:369 start_codon:yes stop_codon:yes gene_type:complete
MGCTSYQYNGCASIDIGRDFSSKITYTPSSGTAFDFTDYTITMTIRERNAVSDTLVLTNVGDSTTTGIYVEDPESGVFYIQIRKEESALIAANSYTYVIDFTSPGGDLTAFLAGDISFIEVG